MKLNETLQLPSILWAEAAAAQNQDHGIAALELREGTAFACMVG
jgi:hypothetical protein